MARSPVQAAESWKHGATCGKRVKKRVKIRHLLAVVAVVDWNFMEITKLFIMICYMICNMIYDIWGLTMNQSLWYSLKIEHDISIIYIYINHDKIISRGPTVDQHLIWGFTMIYYKVRPLNYVSQFLKSWHIMNTIVISLLNINLTKGPHLVVLLY